MKNYILSNLTIGFILFLSPAQAQVSLTNDSTQTGQGMVIPFGRFSKQPMAAAVNVLEAKNFNQGIIIGPEQLFQGRLTGTQTAANSGERNSRFTTIIRGLSSLDNFSPLYVIDGIPLSNELEPTVKKDIFTALDVSLNPLSFINAEDIERIEILKDASAALYGARAANGVVLITTKKGKETNQFDYKYTLGVVQMSKRYDLLDAKTYREATRPQLDFNKSTDWQKEIFKRTFSHQHHLSFGTSTENSHLRVSLNYLNQNGIIENIGNTRYNAHLVGEKMLFENRLKIGINATYAKVQSTQTVDNFLQGVLTANPTKPVRDSLSQFSVFTDFSTQNPVALLDYSKDIANTQHILASTYANFKIIDGLSLNTRWNFNGINAERRMAFTNQVRGFNDGALYENSLQYNAQNMEFSLDYEEKNGDFSFYTLLGVIYKDRKNMTSERAFMNYAERTAEEIMQSNKGMNTFFSGYKQNQNSLAYFSYTTLSYKKQYMLSISLRKESPYNIVGKGTSYIFPGLMGKWNLHEATFMKKSIFSTLALRSSYSITANVSENSIEYFSPFTPIPRLVKVFQTNIGVDMGLFENRVTCSIDIFKKKTKGIYGTVYAQQPSVIFFYKGYLPGTLESKGLEINLGGTPVLKKNFMWEVSFNATFNRVVLSDLENTITNGYLEGQGLAGAYVQKISTDNIPYTYNLREFDKFDSNGYNTYENNADFQQTLEGKSPFPTFMGGISNRFNYRNFDLSFLFHGVLGNYIYNNTQNALFTKGTFASGQNVTKEVLNSKENALNTPDSSTRFLEKGNFLKLSNLSVSYLWKPTFTKKVSVRFALSGQNLFTFTPYTGQDPEFIISKNNFGIDYLRFPSEKTFSFSTNLNF
jgi:TonB-dependent starch-binding outer membrane protein SusC